MRWGALRARARTEFAQAWSEQDVISSAAPRRLESGLRNWRVCVSVRMQWCPTPVFQGITAPCDWTRADKSAQRFSEGVFIGYEIRPESSRNVL